METTQRRKTPMAADTKSASIAPHATSVPEPGKDVYGDNNILAVSLLLPLAILLAFGGITNMNFQNFSRHFVVQARRLS